MDIIPKVIINDNSYAEKTIFHLLKRMDYHAHAVALHSLNCSEHDYKQWSEIDFCLLLPEGIFVLEVKGGHVSHRNGIWQFSGQNRRGSSKEGPFKQASSARYSLEKILEKKFKFDRKLRRWPICFGWGVIMPDTTWQYDTVEMPKDVVADKAICSSLWEFESYIKHLAKYWSKKNRYKQEAYLSQKDISLIKKAMRPNIDFLPEFQIGLQSTRSQITQFTEEQFDVVESISQNQQIIVEGGAGTGKTFTAVQMARIDAKDSKSVLFVTESPLLAAHLSHCEPEPNINIISYRKLQTRSFQRQFDVLYVDEGQDLIDLQVFDKLSPLLKGGLEKGTWRWFMDPNHQSKIRGFFDPEALQVLKGGFSDKPILQSLKNNVRNSKQIISLVESLTGAKIGNAKVNETAEDPLILKIKSVSLASTLKQTIKSLVNKKVTLEDIGLIVSSEISSENMSRVLKVVEEIGHEINGSTINAGLKNKLLFGDVKNFKGLEWPVIIGVGFNIENEDPAYLNEKYVAVTRANYTVILIELET